MAEENFLQQYYVFDVISYQEQSGGCTVSRLAKTLHISNSAATMKVNELMHLGLVEKCAAKRTAVVVYLHLSPLAAAGVRKRCAL